MSACDYYPRQRLAFPPVFIHLREAGMQKHTAMSGYATKP
jgi:hypothetical protein